MLHKYIIKFITGSNVYTKIKFGHKNDVNSVIEHPILFKSDCYSEYISEYWSGLSLIQKVEVLPWSKSGWAKCRYYV